MTVEHPDNSAPVRTASEGLPPYLAVLNEQQCAAAQALDGPVLVLAGAGTGKTRVLTARLGHILMTRRAFPGQILSVTFTNRAAREMQQRVGSLIGQAVEGMPWLGTFHSVAARILRRHAELVGLKSNFTILDTDDQIRLLKQLISAADIDDKRWPARALAGMIDNWKNRGLTPDKVPASEGEAFANGRGCDMYRQYQDRLVTLNAADFGDLLLHCLTLFTEHPDILESWQERFRYILVDEYQDTNVAQYLWLRLLAQKHKNICCVGDDDQSIYGWRGAEVGNILRFEKDFPGAQVIRLERNYRSTPHILGAASMLIDRNKGRLGKTLWTDINEGEKVTIRSVWDGEEEARFVGEKIEQLHKQGHSLNDAAVLVRISAQTRSFEERFITLGMPYRVIGGLRFYERAEIRDAMAYMRVIAQSDDDLAFERIINVPKRGLGDATMQILHGLSRSQAMPLTRAAELLSETDELRAAARRSLGALMASFSRWRGLVELVPHTELMETVLDESGYTEKWRNDKSPDAPGRLENLKELVRAMEPFNSLAEFLEHVSLVMDNEQTSQDDMVSLMTLHGAKGLEFPTVFLPGWEEGLFPSERAMDEGGTAALEEERRLAYVGITRARERAFISFASARQLHGQWLNPIPSRFIDELPAEHIEWDEPLQAGTGSPHTSGSSRGFMEGGSAFTYDGFGLGARQGRGQGQDGDDAPQSPGWRRAASRNFGRSGGAARREVQIEGNAELVSEIGKSSAFDVGEIVHHRKFGDGTVVQTEGDKMTVDFGNAGVKKVMASFLLPGQPPN